MAGEERTGSGIYGTFDPEGDAEKKNKKIWNRRAVVALWLVVGFVVLLFLLLVASQWFLNSYKFYPERGPFLHQTGDLTDDMSKLMDLSVDPCSDFYSYACGGFMKSQKLKPDQLEFARAWDGVSHNNTERLLPILAASQGPAGIFYRSCMNTTAINALGTAPLRPFVQQVQEVKDLVSLTAVIYWWHYANVVVFYDWSVEMDPNQPTHSALNLMQGGITMPSVQYYTSKDPAMQVKKQGYLKVAKKVLYRVCLLIPGCDTAIWPGQAAVQSLQVETALAERFATPEEQRTEVSTPRNIEEITKLAPNLHLRRFINAMAGTYHSREDTIASKITIIIRNVKYFTAISDYLKSEDLDAIKAYVLFRLGFVLGADMDSEMEDTGFELQRIVTGQAKKVPRWKKCIHAATNALPDDVGKLFVDHFFTIKSKQAAEQMLLRLKLAFKEDLLSVSWMVNKTREAALSKLHHMFFAVGKPAHWNHYDGVHLDEARYLWNGLQLSEWYIHHSFTRLTHTSDPHRWGSTSPTFTDAFYSYTANGLFVPAGILQEPFFSPQHPDARNYGALGGILAHEITHGFDDQGRQFGSDGKLVNWWTEADTRRFKQKADCIVHFFSQFEIGGTHVNGELTLGENIADMGGVKVAHSALQALRTGQRSALTQTEERLFFTSWGQNWCTVERARAQELQLLTDEHSPNKFRVNGPLSSFPPFAHAFQCPKGAKMNPEKRCHLW